MKKNAIIISIVLIFLVIAIIVGVILFMNKEPKTNLKPVESAEDLVSLVNEIYTGQEESLPKLDTKIIEVSDVDSVKYATGLENGNDLQYLAVSEPMMSSQAYSFIIAKVKNGVDASNIAKTMSEKVDMRKWICVSAEKLYATNSGDIVCLVMSSEEWAKPVYDKFKSLAGNIGEEYTKTEELPELPEEMY